MWTVKLTRVTKDAFGTSLVVFLARNTALSARGDVGTLSAVGTYPFSNKVFSCSLEAVKDRKTIGVAVGGNVSVCPKG